MGLIVAAVAVLAVVLLIPVVRFLLQCCRVLVEDAVKRDEGQPPDGFLG